MFYKVPKSCNSLLNHLLHYCSFLSISVLKNACVGGTCDAGETAPPIVLHALYRA